MKKIIHSLVALTLLFAVPLLSQAAMTVIVSGNTAAGENQPGWLFNRDLSTATPYTFNTDAASIGTGSLYVQPIGSNPSDKFIGENFLNTPIANVNSISYDFKIGSGGTNDSKDQFYMNVYANFGVSPDDKFYDCRYDIVPTTGSTASFTTVTFDPTQAYPVTQSGTSPANCPAVPMDMNALSPNSTIRAFALNVGDTSTSDVGLSGYLDKVVTDLDSDVITYDFEPDTDGDGLIDANDNCPTVANSDQANADGDSQGDLCDTDDDNDGVADVSDNCPVNSNPDQMDTDGDGAGNACDSLIGPATDMNQCKNGGWRLFNNPAYKNQGQCVSATVRQNS